ncbi:MAG: Arm DNA-binding domain-containing protein, partial [Pseudolabrys sp.]
MAVAKLTKTVVEGIAKGGKIWDTAVVGLGVRRQTTDAIWYLLRYSAGGRQRTYSIGRHGSPWTVETARTEAKRLLGLVASGRDPLAEREAEANSQRE